MRNAKWTHGWIVGVVITQRASWQTSISTKNMFTPLYLCAQTSSYVFIQERRCLPVHLHHRKSSQSINSPERSNCSAQKEQHYRLMTATRASNWLHRSHFCQAWQYTTDYCWELERETALPLLIIFWHCFPLFLIYDIHLWWDFAAGGFWGASVTSFVSSLSLLSNKNHHGHMTMCLIRFLQKCHPVAVYFYVRNSLQSQADKNSAFLLWHFNGQVFNSFKRMSSSSIKVDG